MIKAERVHLPTTIEFAAIADAARLPARFYARLAALSSFG